MHCPRLFVANHLKPDTIISLDSGQAHYLLHVLRLTEGSSLLVFDGKHGEWRAKIVKSKKGGCQIQLAENTREQTTSQDLHYAFAPLKQARLDYMVQKAVEMGASSWCDCAGLVSQAQHRRTSYEQG